MRPKPSANNGNHKRCKASAAVHVSERSFPRKYPDNGNGINEIYQASINVELERRSSTSLTDDDDVGSFGSSSMVDDVNDSAHPSIFGDAPETISLLLPKTSKDIYIKKKERATHTAFKNNGDKIAEGIDEITEQMGKIWFPHSVEELDRTHERDKYGRLVPCSEDVKPKRSLSAFVDDSSSSSSRFHSDGATKFNYSEWHDTRVLSVHGATPALRGRLPYHIDANGDIEGYEPTDQKYETSVMLTKRMDKIWSKEMYELDPLERDIIINEIHGIKSSRWVEETEESVKEAITSFRAFLENNLDQELDNRDSIVPPVTKDHYRRAVYELKSGYIISKDFLIKFLRICHYNFEDAALRYFRYLDLLHLLFGDDSLTRSLELTDLTKRELRYLRKGQMQLLPTRDRAGRRMFSFSGCDDWHFTIREKYRVNIYLVDVLSDDVPSQKLGSVTLNAPRVRYNVGDNPFNFEGMTLRAGKQELLGGNHTEAQFFRKINEAVPIRFSAIHYFAPSTLIYNIGKAIILTLLGKDHRKIVRFHAGSEIECYYGLGSFGIPHEDITITEGGNIKTKNVQKFINARRTIESFQQRERERNATSINNIAEECPGIECPGLNCIVFGDKGMSNLPANLEFRELLKDMEREREESLQSGSNVLPVKQFVESIIAKARSSEYDLRFLCFDKNSSLFVDLLDHNELCKRVSQALRDQRKRAKVREKTSSPVRVVNTDSSGSCVLDESASSIMGMEAAKRLKRSYNGSSIASFCFCPDGKSNSSEENSGSNKGSIIT